jgi:hypothetical protein
VKKRQHITGGVQIQSNLSITELGEVINNRVLGDASLNVTEKDNRGDIIAIHSNLLGFNIILYPTDQKSKFYIGLVSDLSTMQSEQEEIDLTTYLTNLLKEKLKDHTEIQIIEKIEEQRYEKKNFNQNVIDMVRIINKRRKMFFGDKAIDIYNLSYYLMGYSGARNSLGFSDEMDEKFPIEFSTWIYRKYEHLLDHNTFWAEAISNIEKDNSKQADLFFSLFEEFFEIKL